jgi:ribosomal protein L37AE/L43A
MYCQFCHNEIKENYKCPECETVLTYKSGEGPTGTYECEKCSNVKRNIGYRLTPFGLMKVDDLVGRYAPKRENK